MELVYRFTRAVERFRPQRFWPEKLMHLKRVMTRDA